MIICKKCKKAVSYNSYFQKYICNNCSWECIENNAKTNIEEDIKILNNALKRNKKQFEEIGIHILLQEKLQQAIENILADRERLEKENNKNKEELEILNKIKRKYKIALFIIIRNSKVMPKGIKLGKSDKEINKMSYETLCEVLTMIDFKKAEKMYTEGKEGL